MCNLSHKHSQIAPTQEFSKLFPSKFAMFIKEKLFSVELKVYWCMPFTETKSNVNSVHERSFRTYKNIHQNNWTIRLVGITISLIYIESVKEHMKRRYWFFSLSVIKFLKPLHNITCKITSFNENQYFCHLA